jgi:hypothetical protein
MAHKAPLNPASCLSCNVVTCVNLGLDGNLYMFGGRYTGSLYFSEMWRFTRSTRQFMLVMANSINQLAIYNQRRVYQGSVGTPTTPGGREGSCSVVDPVKGGLYLYSGALADSTNRMDIFMFNTTTNLWIWMAGVSATSSTPPQYPPVGQSLPAGGGKGPGSKINSMCWFKDSRMCTCKT